MAGQFLRAAYRVLYDERRPMTAEQLCKAAERIGQLRSNGLTPHHTMRARLSDEIRKNGVQSIFLRVGPNRFALREWGGQVEYHARPFEKPIDHETTSCVISRCYRRDPGVEVGFDANTSGLLEFISNPNQIYFIPRAIAERSKDFRQLVSYVFIETPSGRVLSYTRGKYSSADKLLLLGKKSIGFGGHVLKQDTEGLFAFGDAGILECARREIAEELGGIVPESLWIAGTISDDTSSEGQKHIGVVLRGKLTIELSDVELKTELSINKLEALSKQELWSNFHNFEFWSQILVREFAKELKPANISTIVPPVRPRQTQCIAIVGEIANGKSSLSKAIGDHFSYPVVSASACLERILGVTMADESNRLKFQEWANDFIKSPSGPAKLASQIASSRNTNEGFVIIDGLRHISTLNELRKLIPHLTVVYVDCPRDVAFANYRKRDTQVQPTDFARVREHPVEADLPNFRFHADAVLNNADSFENSCSLLKSWLGDPA